MIEVTYDGEYPNACRGKLTIKQDGKIIYNKKFCCSSSGSVWFDDWGAHTKCGELTWCDANEFSQEIQDAVADVLSSVSVCCGGCI